MNIVQLTPGAGGMYCGNCFRDNALVATLRTMGHPTLMVPLYLPITLDEEDQSAGTPVFFSGINVYLDQKSAWFRQAPYWLHKLLCARPLLRRAAGRAAKTRAQDVGELMLSMLRGEEGHQARELDDLIAWLKTQPKPDMVCLSNALLVGLARKLKEELRVAVVSQLQGEDSFLDGLPGPYRAAAWKRLSERAADVDLFIAPSRYFGELMGQRLHLPVERVKVVYNGINLQGYGITPSPPLEIQTPKAISSTWQPPVLGYFARMCREKGLDTLVEAYLLLKQRRETKNLRLHVGGGCGPADELFVNGLRQKLGTAGVLNDVQFFPNVSRAAKLEFYRGLAVFSTPALYGEAFGLYVIEALAAGVPVVQPRQAAFPEILEATSGGILCAPGDPKALANAIESLLLDPARAVQLGQQGRQAVQDKFSVERMAQEVVRIFEEVMRVRKR